MAQVKVNIVWFLLRCSGVTVGLCQWLDLDQPVPGWTGQVV